MTTIRRGGIREVAGRGATNRLAGAALTGVLALMLATSPAGCDGAIRPSPADTGPQGALVFTGIPTDLAIEGAGLLMVGSADDRTLVRGGSFQLKGDGRLIDAKGRALLGYNVIPGSPYGLVAPLSAVDLGAGTTVLTPTNHVDLAGNLDPAARMTTFALNDPSRTTAFSTAVKVYDSNHNLHVLRLYFTRSGPGAWNWYVVQEAEADRDPVDRSIIGASGELRFDVAGTLVGAKSFRSVWTFFDAVPDQEIAWNFGPAFRQAQARSDDVMGPNWSSQSIGDEANSRMFVKVDPSGGVRMFENASERVAAFVAVYMFANPTALAGDSESGFRVTEGSGPASATLYEHSRGFVQSGFLELR